MMIRKQAEKLKSHKMRVEDEEAKVNTLQEFWGPLWQNP